MMYCPNCGNELKVKKPGIEWFCESCNESQYANPVLTIDAMLFDEEGRILLGVRNRDPYKGKLNLPGGFVDPNETLEQAIKRELREELGIEPLDYGELLYAGSRVDHHTNRQTIAVIMIGEISHRDFKPNDEVSGFVWRLPKELTPGDTSNELEYNHIIQAAKLWPVRPNKVALGKD